MNKTDDVCEICSITRAAHGTFRHEFVARGESPSLVEKRTPPVDASSSDPSTQGAFRLPSQSDPVLRMALIRAKIISVADIEAVENELRATGIVSHEPNTLG